RRQIGMSQHRSFWVTRRTAGVEERRHFVLMRLGRVRGENAIRCNEASKIDLASAMLRTLPQRTSQEARARFWQEDLEAANHNGPQPCLAHERGGARVMSGRRESYDDLDLGVSELIFEFSWCRERTEIDRTAAGHQYAKEADDMMWRVWKMQSHANARPHSQR